MRESERPKEAFLLGVNISRSISPACQNVAFRKSKINATYDLRELDPSGLPKFVRSLSSISKDVLGFNVTAPFKEEIIDFLSSLDPRSKAIGAVNTVKVSKSGKLIGFNTDFDGIVASLNRLHVLNKSKKNRKAVAMVIGAGGAARACVYTLLENGFSRIIILNRTFERARQISSQFSKSFPKSKIEVYPLTEANLHSFVNECGLIINAISSSNEHYFPTKIDFAGAERDTKVFDLGYKGESLFLKSARKNHLKSIDGKLMLVVQASKSFEIWTGRKFPLKALMAAATKALRDQA